jgi:hypothetical protein
VVEQRKTRLATPPGVARYVDKQHWRREVWAWLVTHCLRRLGAIAT